MTVRLEYEGRQMIEEVVASLSGSLNMNPTGWTYREVRGCCMGQPWTSHEHIWRGQGREVTVS